MHPHRLGVAALVLLSPVLTASPAGAQCACSGSTCPADRPPFFSSSVSPQLAPNARILARLDRYDPETVALATSDGAPVTFTLEPAGDAAGLAFWLTPTEPLATGSYVVSAALRGLPTAVTPQTRRGRARAQPA